MRLHHLEVTAFGPFADTVTVDFDQLSDAGLFLLSGATGAGKTSVLDAVCFALYGDVPGDRNAARRLRSDQAAPGVAPRVELEATLSGRRFRITRSPAWERPKKRGTGTTTQQASVTISERVEGAWHPLSSRLDETGHLVTRLVGMNVTQFTQVAMLPQGRFQAFLRARSDERHKLLQQLFRTGRFDAVERWLRDRRLTLRRESDAAHQRVADLVSRISEATDADLPEDWDIRELSGPAATGAALGWAAGLRDTAKASLQHATTETRRAAGAESGARGELETARVLLERRARVEAALAEQERLLAAADDHAEARRRLDAARRAAGVAPVHRMAAAATLGHQRAAAAADKATSRAAEQLGLLLVDEDTVARAVEEAVDAAARVRAALPVEELARSLTVDIADATRSRALLDTRLGELTGERAALPGLVTDLRAELADARTATQDVVVLTTRLEDLESRLASHAQADLLDAELSVARTALDAARTTATRHREEWLDLREARLDGMAAEIAGSLAVGACCPVCGSAEHPHRASPAPDAPDALAEKAALKALDDAKSTEHVHDELVRDLTTRLAVARGSAGDVPAQTLREERTQVRSDLDRLAAVAGRAEALEGRLEKAEADRERLTEAVATVELEARTLDATIRAKEGDLAAARSDLQDLLAGSGASDLSDLLELHLARVESGRRAAQALDDLAAARAALDESARELGAATGEAGFDSPDDAMASVLPPHEIDALDRSVADHQHRLASVATVLDEPGARELAATASPDLPALESVHGATLAALGEVRSREAVWAVRSQRLTTLVTELSSALDDWSPVREALELTSGLASFVDGKAPDNRLQMRLSAYVLAYRLAQVVAAANERLAGMSDQRYSLEHTGRRGAGETRGGLSLLVRDDWSGEARDPATLSGGETFVVSLALALGLADVITQEAGGADLDTLFVDEGFGSLDADTLDDVMDTLDSLRDGGRVVGVVSHVAEMRDRIPTQLRVTKSRRGSTLAVVR
ncbi:MAG TPA: SMC family ATPase [Nocardioides sp.]|nr:SMC family ATPase [Nocardioides sp.]